MSNWRVVLGLKREFEVEGDDLDEAVQNAIAEAEFDDYRFDYVEKAEKVGDAT